MGKKLGYILYLLVVAALLLSGVELAARQYNKNHFNVSFPLFLIPSKTQASFALDATFVNHAHNIIDPQLGAVWNPSEHENFVVYYKHKLFHSFKYIPGFVYFGDPSVKNDLVIVALGGSTTQGPWYPSNWPEFLYQSLTKKGIKALVYNGGVAGYTSNQELIKLIRDGLELKPDIIISYDGVNDIGFLYSIPEHPMITPYQKQLMDYVIGMGEDSPVLPNTVYAFKRTSLESRKTRQATSNYRKLAGVNFGPEVKTTPAKQWVRNHRIMSAVCAEFGVKYFVFLQPTMGVGKYAPNAAEQAMFKEYVDSYPGGNYLRMVNEFYDEARSECGKHSGYCVDFTGILDGKSGLYTDVRHVNEEGNKAIGEAVCNYVTSHP